MKIDMKSVLVLLFIFLSIWLSFAIKQTKEKLFQSENQVIEQERELRVSKYKLDIIQEALELNIGMTPVQISRHTPAGLSEEGLHNILYLKAHACSPCNMPVIEGIINAAAGNSNFQVASHASNRHFLQPVILQNGLEEGGRVNWLTHKLYEYHHPVFDAELLFVDAKGFVLGVLPLELLKERELFASWLASSVYSSDDFKSSDENRPPTSSDDSRSSDE